MKLVSVQFPGEEEIPVDRLGGADASAPSPEPKQNALAAWGSAVLDRCTACARCGDTRHLVPARVIPESEGGSLTPENGIVLCRTCMFERLWTERDPAHSARPLLTIYLPADLYDAAARVAPQGVSRLVRRLMEDAVRAPAILDGLAPVPVPDASRATRLLARTSREAIDAFKAILPAGTTMSDAVRALLSAAVHHASTPTSEKP